jgi:eukaryotic-like serine/threonine-protein kinase
LNACPFCDRPWEQHTARCEWGVPAVDLRDERGLAGKVISGYRILGGIGRGGMGTVYLAVDNLDEGQLDAVKVLNRDWLVDRERLRREAVTANRVDHPNVCRIYNYVEAYDTEASVALTLVAMELVRGPTLREVQEERGGVLELSRAARVVKEVAEALEAIHAQDIIHRDIKPTNIIVTADPDGAERVKIVDFGIAKKVGGGEGQDLTEPGMVAATVHYASPEQLRGKPGKRSDVYALGVVLYELLAGRRPYEASNQAELFSMILDPGVKLPRLQEIRPDLNYPRSLQSVVDRALERDPSKRFASAAEFSAALTGVVPSVAETVRVSMADLPPPTLGPTPLPAAESAWQRIRRTVLPTRAFKVGVSVGAIVLAVALFFGLGGLDLIRPAPGALTLSLDPPSALVRSGESLELEAAARDRRGRVVERDGFAWSSQDPDVAGVSSSGVLTGGRVGRTVVLAVLGSDTARTQVEVLPGSPARVDLDPPSLALREGESERIEARVTDAFDNRIPGAEVVWSSTLPEVAEVDPQGTVRGRSPGNATVVAEVGAARWQVEVTVARAVTPESPPDLSLVCPNPVMTTLDGLDAAMDDPAASQRRLRDTALACWNRGSALSTQERAYAAWLVGSFTFNMEGCSANAVQWLERAVNLDPQSESYRVALAACRN